MYNTTDRTPSKNPFLNSAPSVRLLRPLLACFIRRHGMFCALVGINRGQNTQNALAGSARQYTCGRKTVCNQVSQGRSRLVFYRYGLWDHQVSVLHPELQLPRSMGRQTSERKQTAVCGSLPNFRMDKFLLITLHVDHPGIVCSLFLMILFCIRCIRWL